MTKKRALWYGNVTSKSKIATENIHSLGFRDTREGVTSKRLILRSLECNLVQPSKGINLISSYEFLNLWGEDSRSYNGPCICQDYISLG